jgi:hypothetical protein
MSSRRIKPSGSFVNLVKDASGDAISTEMFQDTGLWHHMAVKDKTGKLIAIISAPEKVVAERPEYFNFVD